MPSTREQALSLCAVLTPQLEGCKLTAYADTGGKLTIGYGHTQGVTAGETISQETANYLLRSDLSVAADTLERCVPAATLDRNLDNHERAALIDFCFNLGGDPSWQIWKDVATNLPQVPGQIQRFDHGMEGGKLVVIPGLEHRRTAEIIFWNTADVAVSVAVTQVAAAVPAPSSGYTRAISTPPAPTPAPAGTQVGLAAKIGGGVAAVGAGVQQVHDIIAPHADESHWFASAAAICTGVVIVASVVGLIIHAEQAQARKT